MEKINVIGEAAHERLMLNAAARLMKDNPEGWQKVRDSAEKGQQGERATYITVECRINGVEVPLMESLKEMLERTKEHYDEEATRRAVDIIKTSGLGKVYDTLNNLRYEIIKKIEEAGFTVPEDSY